MADEEFALDLSRSAPVTSNNEGARTVPIPLTPRSTTVRQDGRDPIITTGFSRSPIPGGSHDLPGTSSAKQWPAFHAQNTAAGIPEIIRGAGGRICRYTEEQMVLACGHAIYA